MILGEDNIEELYKEGLKYFPKLKVIDSRFYLNYPKNRGSFSINGFKNHITSYKIHRVLDWLKKNKEVKNLNFSLTTMSVYFEIGDKKIRVSDHKKTSFDGIDIIVRWDTNSNDIKNQFSQLISENNLRTLIREVIEILDESVQEADKYYFKPGKLSPRVKEIILKITDGDYLTKTITDIYWAMLQQSKKESKWIMATLDNKEDDIDPDKEEEINPKEDVLGLEEWKKLKVIYQQLKEYNKNVFPIKDLRFDNFNHTMSIIATLKQRAKIIEDLKKLPSIAIRNLKSEIRAERNWKEMNDFRHYLEYFLGLYSQLSNRDPELQKSIERKLFKSNTTLKQLIDFAEEKENLLGGFEFNRENLKELIDENSYDMRVVYDKGSIVVIEVTSPHAIKKIGCNSLWCFTYGSGFDSAWRQWNNYSTNDVVYVIVNFSEKTDSPDFMHVLIRPLKKEYDEDDDESTLPLFNMANEVDHNPIWTLKNMFGKVNLNKIFEF